MSFVDKTTDESGQEVNQYLLRREQKIKRNKERLEQLGLLNFSKKTESKKRKIEDTQSTLVASRKSRRIKERKERKIGSHYDDEQDQVKPPDTQDSVNIGAGGSSEAGNDVRVKKSATLKFNSSRNTNVNVNNILFGLNQGDKIKTEDGDAHPYQNGLLGQRVEKYGKAPVIELACDLSGNSSIASFNKYSGVCEWQNKSFFLWVNFGGPNADTENQFLDKAEFVTWFGGAKTQESSPLIQKLINVSREAMLGLDGMNGNETKLKKEGSIGENTVNNASRESRNEHLPKNDITQEDKRPDLESSSDTMAENTMTNESVVASSNSQHVEQEKNDAAKEGNSYNEDLKSLSEVHQDTEKTRENPEIDAQNEQSHEQIGLSKDCGIILWCRKYDPMTKRFEPYTCLGRVGYHKHYSGTLPVKFIWKLLDYHRLKQYTEDGQSVLRRFAGASFINE